MSILDISNIVKSRGIKRGNLNKSPRSRTIQLVDGDIACYGTAYIGECDQY